MRSIVVVLVLGLVIAGLVPVVPALAQPADTTVQREQLEELGKQFTDKDVPTRAARLGTVRPKGPNPWLSLLPPQVADDVDIGYWKALAQARSQRVTAQREQEQRAVDEFVVDEKEPQELRGSNDTQSTAQFIRRLGTRDRKRPQVRILGTLAAADGPLIESSEDDGAIPLANPTGLADGARVRAEGEIGDGPHGSASSGTGDFDHYGVPDVAAGDEIRVDVDTPEPFGDLDPTVTVYDAAGEPIAFNDDDGQSLDSLLSFTAPADGDYFVAVEGFGTFQEDPFDPASGVGVGSEGGYTVTIGRNAGDVDYFSVDLEAGDVVSAKVEDSATNVRLFAPDGTEVMGSSQDASFIYPADTQLTGGGNALLDHVAAESGRFALRVSMGSGDYEATIRVVRPGFEQRARAVQTVFLDFDGAEINTRIFDGPGVRKLSPLSAFLGRWGLRPADEDALIDAIVAETRENLRRDLRRQGANPNVAVRLRNSRDHGDRFGRRNWSRVIVGGTIREAGIATIGIAQSIDPGNFGSEESALVLLDILSARRPGAFGDPELNTYIGPESDVIAFVGQAVGNIVSHEIGHFIGSWHVDESNGVPNLMDAGGNFPLLFGVGPDGIGGTADDDDVDFGEDIFNLFEGFTGLEDTLNRSAFGLTASVR